MTQYLTEKKTWLMAQKAFTVLFPIQSLSVDALSELTPIEETIRISLHYTAGSIQVRGLLKPKICGSNFLYLSPKKLT